MADRVWWSSLVLLGFAPGWKVRASGRGWSGTLLGPEGTGVSLVASGRHGLVRPGGVDRVDRPVGGVVVAADHGEPVVVIAGERGVARSLRTAQWTRASL